MLSFKFELIPIKFGFFTNFLKFLDNLLTKCLFILQEAVRLLVMGKSLLNPDHELADYNYTG